jgi:hypothetical protein
VAGVAGAVASLSRPSGLAVVAAATVVAGLALYRRRDPKALAAPALSVLGIGAYFAYLGNRTGQPLAWFENQRDFWGQQNDAGGYLVGWVRTIFQGQWQRPDEVLLGVIVLVLVPVLVFFVRHRPPDLAVSVYLAVTLVVTLSSVLGPRPRFLLASFPLIFPFAHRWEGTRHQLLVATGFALLAVLTVYYAAGGPAAVGRFDLDGVPIV